MIPINRMSETSLDFGTGMVDKCRHSVTNVKRTRFFPLLALAVVAAACGDAYEGTDSSTCTGVEPTFNSIQAEIFSKSCAFSGCHGRGSKNGGLTLDSNGGDVYANLAGVDSTEVPLKRVAAGDPENSYLLKKLEGKDIEGTRMPQIGDPLAACRIQTIRDWIAAGAPKN